MDVQVDHKINPPNSDSIDDDEQPDSYISESDDHAKNPTAIQTRTKNCQNLFKSCQRHPVLSESDWIDKMSGDFNWWSLGIGAAKSGHSSLDYRVRTRDDVRNVLISLLDSLVVSLNNCIDIVLIRAKANTYQVDPNKLQHHISEVKGEQKTKSTVEATQSPLSDEDGSEIDEQIYYIKTTLQFLSKMAIAIRKSGTKFRHQRIDKYFEERAHELEAFRNYLTYLVLMGPLKVHLLDGVLYRHTRTEELIWKKVWIILRAYLTDAQRLSPVQERLIRANLVRRNRFDIYFGKYCRRIKADKGSKATLAVRTIVQIKENVSKSILDNQPTPIQTKEHNFEAKLQDKHKLPRQIVTDDTSAMSSQQPATEIGSLIIPQQPRTERTRSVSTKFSQGVLKQDYPKCPTAEDESFWCPYCAQALDSSYSNQKNNRKWRGHVAEDLSPYVCVYADCDKPDGMYITTDEWKKHLKDCHRESRWICEACWLESDNPTKFEFDLEEEWHDHIVTEHSGEYDDDDLPDLVEASRRRVTPPVSCPLCFGNTPLLQPETDNHIAEHLHSFALQALPWETIGPDDDTRASVGSNVRKTVPSDDSDELLDEEGDWDETYDLPDLINAILTCCTNVAKRQEVAGLPTLNLKLTHLNQTLQDLPQRFMFYDSEVRSEIAICLTHLELTLRRLTDSDYGLIYPRALESLEADIVARLASLNTLMELGEKSIVDPLAPDKSVESTYSKALEPGLWSRAFQELDEKTREWIPESSQQKAEGGKQWADDLIALVREREQEYKDKNPKLNVGNREIFWRDYANKIVTWLVTIGDIAINFAPAPSPIIWSALKVLMKINVTQYEDLVAIFGCAEKVLSLMRRGAVYEIVYLKDATSSTAAEDLQKILVDLYKTLLQLLAHALHRVKEGHGRQFLCALINPEGGAELVSALSTHEHKLSMAAQDCGTVGLQEHQKLLQSLSAPLRRMDENVKDFIEHLQEKSQEEALDYISGIPVGKHHFEMKEKRAPETCEWLVKQRRFLEWEDSSRSSILWLHGNIGTGKSFLTCKVIDRYWFDKEEKVKHDEGFAYFYCTRSDPTRRDPRSIYRSYIRQLARINHSPNGMHKSICDLYRKAKNEQRGPSIAECKTALSELLKSYPQTTLVLDALDECEVQARTEIAITLHSLVADSERPVKVYISSRREPDIERSLDTENLIEIGTTDNKGDIEKYIEQEMSLFSEEWESVSEGVRDKVKRTITDQSDGMFRWAYLQWEQLKKFKSDQSILERLGKLPETLERAYDEIYLQNTEKVMLQRAAKWVLCAAEPLTNSVLLWAIRLEIQTDSEAEAALTVSSPISQSTLESVCCNLIVRDSQLKVWKFPHASAAEYFEARHKDWTGSAHEDLALLLVSYLIDFHSRWEMPHTRYMRAQQLRATNNRDLEYYLDPRHPLEGYARVFWAWHAQKISNHHRVSPILQRFLGAKGPQKFSSPQYQLWCRSMQQYGSSLDPKDLFPADTYVFGICAFGLHALLEGWWDKDLDVSLINDRGMDLLSIAAKYGHHNLCSDLIDRGSDMTRALRSNFGSALLEAIRGNHFEIVALFLSKGFNPNCHFAWSSLLCLLIQGDRDKEGLLEMLLKAGADPNIQCLDGCSFGCALEAAVSYECMGLADILINHGADVNAQLKHGRYGSSLAAAAAHTGGLECVKLLIKHGADINTQLKHGRYGSPLAAAAYAGLLECVKLLIKHGADINAQLEHGRYGSVLAAAIFGRSLECVKLLIAHGADVNAQLQYGRYGSNLAAAAFGSQKCVELLIEHGADVNAQLKHGDYGSVLAAALLGRSEDIEIIKYLVEEAGADAGILSLHPPLRPILSSRGSAEEVCLRVRYLVEGGYVQAKVLADIGLKVQ